MKRIHKIALLILITAAILSAFTVAALAAPDSASFHTAEIQGKWEGKESGDFIGVHATDRRGYIYADVADNGNRYGVWMPKSEGQANNFIDSYLDRTKNTDKTFKYNVGDYPFVMLDFDIMTPTGSYYTNVDFCLRLYQTSARDGSSKSLGFPIQFYLSRFSSYLKNDPYAWNHVTFVMENVLTTDSASGLVTGAQINITYFVNGNEVKKSSVASALYNGFLPVDLSFSDLRMNAGVGSSTEAKSAFDNLRVSYFTSDYAASSESKELAMMQTVYNGSYTLPYGKTVAAINRGEDALLFDSLEAAINAAAEGESVRLTDDSKESPSVKKKISIDTNVYGEDGAPTGDHYTFFFDTENGYLPEVKDGIYSFSENARTVAVSWDPVCDGECDCFESEVGHRLTLATKASLGLAPQYPVTLSTEHTLNGLTSRLIGWSYEKDGTADDIKPVTEEDIARGSITLYPIYEYVQHSIEVRTEAGSSSYYLADEIVSAFKDAPANSTLILHTDVVTSEQITFSKNLTLDLNGHSYVYRSLIYNDYEAVAEGDQYVKGEAIGTTKLGNSSSAFKFTSSGFEFNLTSSKKGAEMMCLTVTADRLLLNGEAVATENAKISAYNTLYNFYPSGSTFNIYGSNITFYTGTLFAGEHKANTSNLKVNIEGGAFHLFDQPYDGAFAIRHGGTHTVKGASFYLNGAYLYKMGSYDKSTALIFTDCNIYDGLGVGGGASDSVVFNNCRLDLIVETSSAFKPILGQGTISSDNSYKIAAENTAIVPSVFASTYFPVPGFTISTDSLVPVPKAGKLSAKGYYYRASDIETECVSITWQDASGNVLATTYELLNSTATIPYVELESGDGWRAVTNVTEWLDENGVISDLKLKKESKRTFTAIMPPEEEREYTDRVTNALFNVVYYTVLGYNLYVPYDESVTVIRFGENAPTKRVFINGKEYLVCTVYVSATEALEEIEVALEYFIDGQFFSTKFRPDALFYSTSIVTDPNSSDVEKEAVGSLIRYVETSYKAYAASVGETVDEETQGALSDFYSLYTPTPYPETYPDTDKFDAEAFSGLLDSINLEIHTGSIRFIFTLSSEAYKLGYTVKTKELGSMLESFEALDSSGETTLKFKTALLPLRTHVMQSFEIYITDLNGITVTRDGKEARSRYSLATYAAATKNDLARSLYAFGEAVLEYYPIEKTRYPIDRITLFGEDIKDYTIAADAACSAEYRAAEELQAYIYSKSGYWLSIVPKSDADRSIIFYLAENSGGLGYSASFMEGRIDVVSEYESVISSTTISMLDEIFALAVGKTVELNDTNNCEKNVRDIYYSQFGAIGDGINDDSDAIRAAHEYANKYGHTVCADENAKYFIGPITSTIHIKTSVDWKNATFRLDDSVISPDDAARSINIFTVSRDSSVISYTPKTSSVIAELNAAGGIDASSIKALDLGLGYPAMLQIQNGNHRNYIRYGGNANSGGIQREIVLVDEYGNIDPSTPLMFDYAEITKISVYRLDDKPIIIKGGVFTTIANQAPSAYTSYSRGILISRSNVTVRGIEHYVTGEGETGAPYAGFLRAHEANNVLIEDSVFTSHKTYYSIGSGGTRVGNGTYDLGAAYANNVIWKNCTQSNFFNENGGVISGNWGIMGSNYCKNLTYDGCSLSRFDAHCGVYNATVKDSTIQHLCVTGAGLLTVENTHVYNSLLVNLRTDYGNFWHGDVLIKDVTMHTSSAITLVGETWYNHDFGYHTALPANITVDGLKTTGSNKTVNLFSPAFVTLSDNTALDNPEKDASGVFKDENGNPETRPNKNKMSATKSVTIRNNDAALSFVIPDGALHPFFAEMKVIIEE